jgi:hypothetical protein
MTMGMFAVARLPASGPNVPVATSEYPQMFSNRAAAAFVGDRDVASDQSRSTDLEVVRRLNPLARTIKRSFGRKTRACKRPDPQSRQSGKGLAGNKRLYERVYYPARKQFRSVGFYMRASGIA